MASPVARALSSAFAPPSYLSMPTGGIDISTSGIKGALVAERLHGLELSKCTDLRFAGPTFTDGEIADRAAFVKALATVAKAIGTRIVSIALPESKSFLFEADAAGRTKDEWRISIEQRLEELVPLSATDVYFDFVPVSEGREGPRVVGVAYAKRIVDDIASACREAGLIVRAFESEPFSSPRALLPVGDTSTTLIIDIGRTTTKFIVASHRIPRFATTIGIGGHSLTYSVQKNFGVTELEARKVKLARGIVAGEGNEDYLAAMLSTASAIRDEISRRLEFWQTHGGQQHEPITRAYLIGGNAPVRGLAEYLEAELAMPVATGNVFVNFASPDIALPPIDYAQSLVFATAIGLALRTYA